MRAGKAYISSLGTTGLLIASSLLLLAVVGALVAFDRWPESATAETPVVAIAGEPTEAEPAATRVPARVRGIDRTERDTASARGGARATARLPRAATRAAAAQVAADSDSLVKTPAPADPVVSELPAPDAAAPAPVGAPAPPVSTPVPESAPGPGRPQLPLPGEVVPDPTSEDVGLTVVTGPLAESVSPMAPALGGTVYQTGTGLDGALAELLKLTSER